ncbi:hypothetical protein C8R44DRAFT_788509 [Mycena epipterygia]|nr:hypothetical protein C8R44DRAFT_788509 [Mycena epipterygia]
MIVGPTVIQVTLTSLWSVSLVCSYSRALFRKPRLLGSLVGGCAVFIMALAILVPIAFALPLHLSRHPHIKSLLWQAWDCKIARKAIYWNFDYFILDYNYWKSEQIEALHALVLNGSAFCLEAWETLSWVQRLVSPR